MKSLKPCELVVELRARRGIAVWQVKTSDGYAADGSFDIAAVKIVGVAGQTSSGLDRISAEREVTRPSPRASSSDSMG
jgi:hypothetical protein